MKRKTILQNALRKLELKAPPAALWLAHAAAMWGLSVGTPSLSLPTGARLTAVALLAATGFLAGALGVFHFAKRKTSINPHHPSRAASLVVSGIYRHTRNPMYLSLLLGLFAWAFYLQNPAAFVVAWLFAPIMNRLQIKPEERALADKFGEAFAAYCKATRRWI